MTGLSRLAAILSFDGSDFQPIWRAAIELDSADALFCRVEFPRGSFYQYIP